DRHCGRAPTKVDQREDPTRTVGGRSPGLPAVDRIVAGTVEPVPDEADDDQDRRGRSGERHELPAGYGSRGCADHRGRGGRRGGRRARGPGGAARAAPGTTPPPRGPRGRRRPPTKGRG